MYVDNDPDGDMDADDTTEDTALLRTQAAKTEIIVTPISPVRCKFSLRIDCNSNPLSIWSLSL